MSIDYGDADEFGGPWVQYGTEGRTFRRVCPVCGRYVKADESIRVGWLTEMPEPGASNATCAVHGRVTMPFEGWACDLWPDDEL